MTQGEISVDNPFDIEIRDRIINALNLSQEDLRDDCPITIASTGHSKVMIGIKDINMLHNLNPNLPMLSEISKLIGCNGYYVFTLHPEEKTLVHGRMFAPAIGINEDPVTGNANGPLGAYLIHFGLVSHNNESFSFEAVQGEAINRTGKIEIQVYIQENKPQKVKITGNAIIAFSTEIEI